MKRLFLSACCAFAILGLTTATVAAGEITGTGESLKPLHANSECAFSGLNDTYSGNPDVPDADGFFRTQNWGQIPKEFRVWLTGIGVRPSTLCNGHLNPYQG